MTSTDDRGATGATAQFEPVPDRPPARPRGRRPWLLAAGGAAAVAVAVTAVLVTGGGSDPGTPGAAGSPAASGGAAGAATAGPSGSPAASGSPARPGPSGSPARPGASGSPARPGRSGGPTGSLAPNAPTNPGAAPTSVDDPAARAASCSISADSISSMVTAPAGIDTSPADLLRDAVPNLRSELATWSDAALGRPELATAVAVVSGVETRWSAALSAYDSGEPADGDRQLRSARAQLDTLDPLVAKARKALGARCQTA